MDYQFFVFPTPPDARCELRLDDTGKTLIAAPAIHPSGRSGQAFIVPEDTPDGHGAGWTTTAPKKATVYLHGVLWLKRPSCSLDVDTVELPTVPMINMPRLATQGKFITRNVKP